MNDTYLLVADDHQWRGMVLPLEVMESSMRSSWKGGFKGTEREDPVGNNLRAERREKTRVSR